MKVTFTSTRLGWPWCGSGVGGWGWVAVVWLVAAVALSARPPLEGSPFGLAAEEVRTVGGEDEARSNRAAMLSHGHDALLLRVHLIRHARQSIDVQTFIWTDDECGRLLIYELIEAAKRGVRVRIIADQLFSAKDPEIVAYLATAHPNFEIKHYRPARDRIKPSKLQMLFSGLKSFHAVNQRMHNKVMLFDGAVLITGGRNVENTYYDHAVGLNYRDRDVVVVGPVAKRAAESFEAFWKFKHSVPSRELVDVADVIARGDFTRYEQRSNYDFGGYFDALDRDADNHALIAARFVAALAPVERAVFIADDPGKSAGFFSKTARITRELRREFEGARELVTIQTPYLVLSGAAQNLIREMKAANPALRIRVSTNSFASTDNLAAYSANYRLRGTYVQNLALEVHEFKPSPATLRVIFPQYDFMVGRYEQRKDEGGRPPFLSLHAKSLVIDDRLAFIGSYNLDPRSENLNTEVGLLIEDPAFARRLREEIDDDMRAANSWVIARRQLPLRIDLLNSLVDGILSIGPVDVWPIQNTSSFELRPGGTEMSPDDPAFYRNYREVGAFPGAEGSLSNKEILTRLYKAVGSPLTPIL